MITIEEIKKIKARDSVHDIITKIEDPIICEIGIRVGDNFKKMLTPNVIEAYGIDIWKETGDVGQNDNLYAQQELEKQYLSVLKMFVNDKRVEIIREFSVEAAKKFNDNFFDFVYVDADHTYRAVLEDLESWYPKVKSGGVLSGHDYIDGDLTLRMGHPVRFGVIEAVTDFRKKYNITDEQFHVTDEAYASYYILKK